MNIQICSDDTIPPLLNRRRFRNFLQRAAELTGHLNTPGIFRFILLGTDEMTALNALHLGHQGTTDVITYDYRQDLLPGPDAVAAEIYICPAVAREQGLKFGQSLSREICLYAVHGLLHLQGEDDLTDKDRASMRLAESRTLQTLAKRFQLDEIARLNLDSKDF